MVLRVGGKFEMCIRIFQFTQRRTLSLLSAACKKHASNESSEVDTINLEDDTEYNSLVERYFSLSSQYNCFVIHPYVKWGPRKVNDITPEQELQEAKSLINTLSSWKVYDTLAVPLENFGKKQLFGSGTLEKLKRKVRGTPDITAVFVNVGNMKIAQLDELEKVFRVPILDRYKVVMQILRHHAISKHAKLQVALAEIPHLKAHISQYDTHFMSTSNMDTKRQMLQNRETKLKNEISKLRSQRQLLRNRRQQADFPVVAVVGYTNAGKTSVIKALTGDKKLQPQNKLFATLDVTMHSGSLPSKLEILYVDTVGFISNVPTGLIECFVATLEDAVLADIIVHVEDLSSDSILFQRKHVLKTLKKLAQESDINDIHDKMITVGNKCDLEKSTEYEHLKVSAQEGTGLDTLMQQLEIKLLKVTGRSAITFRVPTGGDETRWLYKNATVTEVEADVENSNLQHVRTIITKANLQKFKHNFLNREKNR